MSLIDYLATRPLEPGDWNFILDTWIKTFKKSPYKGMVSKNHYHHEMRYTIEQLVDRGAKIEVAVNPEDREQIVGYSCWEMSLVGVPVIHYIFVKGTKDLGTKDPVWRQKGLGGSLLRGITKGHRFLYTFRTRDGERLNKTGKGVWVADIATRPSLEPIRRMEACGDSRRFE